MSNKTKTQEPKSFVCECLKQFEKKEGVSARISVTIRVRSPEGWTKAISCSPSHGVHVCPLCGRKVVPQGDK